jgi:hypothetical protein
MNITNNSSHPLHPLNPILLSCDLPALKTLFLRFSRNEKIIAELVQYTTKKDCYSGLVLVERVPEWISAQDCIRKNARINLTIVNSIDDVIAAGLKVS